MSPHRWLAALLLFTAVLDPARADDAAAKAEVTKAEQELTDALTKGHGELLEQKLAPDWKYVASDGSLMSRAEIIKAVKSGALKFEQHAIAELDVRVFGEAAVVVGTSTSRGTWEGESFALRDRFTDVFIRKEGKWLCVSSQSSNIEGH